MCPTRRHDNPGQMLKNDIDSKSVHFFKLISTYLVINSYVDIEYVALLQRPTVGDPVSCYVIHRARNTLREPLERIYVGIIAKICFTHLKV